jgi:aspartyl-tRNA(Asn)/glutamyl-tRNA(Gln) amidotransferase subunit A
MVELAADVRAGRSTAHDAVKAAVDAIRKADFGPEGLNAFISYDAEQAAAAAAAVDEAIAGGGEGGVLAGVPVALKDNICTLELPTTCGSRILEGFRSPFEATAVRRLKEAGAIVVGKTNLDEFAMGSSTENSAFGPTRNPVDPARVAGGSSGGSAAAVAAGIVPAALGSETGGSVRQPASFCGIVGLKPSYGRVSRYGLVAFASSFDQIGTFGRTVADAALLLEVISGADPFDSTASDRPVPSFAPALEQGIEGMVVGVPKEYFPAELDSQIAERCREAIERMRAAGAVIREISLPHTAYAIPTYYLIAPAEAASNLARFDGVRYGLRAPDAASTLDVYEETRSLGFGAEVKRRIMLGTYALSAGHYDQYYARAQRVRGLIARDFRRAFDDGVDVIFTPTTPSTAYRFGEKVDDPYQMYLGDIFTVTANLAAIPAISVPIGTVGNLPAGGQFMADRWEEGKMVRAAAALERLLKE